MGVEQDIGLRRWWLVRQQFKPACLDRRTRCGDAGSLESNSVLLTRFDELSETFLEVGVSGFRCGLHMRQTSFGKSHVDQHVHSLSNHRCAD